MRAEWSGINALLYYGPTLMHSLGLQGDAVTLMSAGGIGIVQFLAVFPAIVFIDRLGASLFASIRLLHPSNQPWSFPIRPPAAPSLGQRRYGTLASPHRHPRLLLQLGLARACPGSVDLRWMCLRIYGCVWRQLWAHRLDTPQRGLSPLCAQQGRCPLHRLQLDQQLYVLSIPLPPISCKA